MYQQQFRLVTEKELATANAKTSGSKTSVIQKIVNELRIFFGLPTKSIYRKSRIIKKHTKCFDEFIFKGYDQQTPGLFRPGSFKAIKMVAKN